MSFGPEFSKFLKRTFIKDTLEQKEAKQLSWPAKADADDAKGNSSD